MFEKDLVNCSYYELDDGGIGISMRDKSLMVLPLNNYEIEVVLGDETKVFNRRELAEFIKVASVLIDSENRFMPDMDLIGLNYNGSD